MEIKSENISISIVDNDSIGLKNKNNHEIPCYLEIKMTRSFFKNFFSLKKLRFKRNFLGGYSITKREMEVLNHMVLGKNNSQIANDLNVSVCTAKAHVSSIYNKLSVNSRICAVVKAIKNHIINI